MKFRRLTLLILIAVTAKTASGQEMEPRAYSPAPVGTQFVLLNYAINPAMSCWIRRCL
jgi:hypothetical protein